MIVEAIHQFRRRRTVPVVGQQNLHEIVPLVVRISQQGPDLRDITEIGAGGVDVVLGDGQRKHNTGGGKIGIVSCVPQGRRRINDQNVEFVFHGRDDVT